MPGEEISWACAIAALVGSTIVASIDVLIEA
jgi:hypothetical protein